ncbi:MAG: hypothetical protein ACI88G_000334 [Woeseiaceae bacterium]
MAGIGVKRTLATQFQRLLSVRSERSDHYLLQMTASGKAGMSVIEMLLPNRRVSAACDSEIVVDRGGFQSSIFGRYVR